LPQEELIGKYSTSLHLRKEMDALKIVDLSWPADKLERYLRATYMPGFEPPYALIRGRKVHLVPEASA
jgi:hypothetical protein